MRGVAIQNFDQRPRGSVVTGTTKINHPPPRKRDLMFLTADSKLPTCSRQSKAVMQSNCRLQGSAPMSATKNRAFGTAACACLRAKLLTSAPKKSQSLLTTAAKAPKAQPASNTRNPSWAPAHPQRGAYKKSFFRADFAANSYGSKRRNSFFKSKRFSNADPSFYKQHQGVSYRSGYVHFRLTFLMVVAQNNRHLPENKSHGPELQ